MNCNFEGFGWNTLGDTFVSSWLETVDSFLAIHSFGLMKVSQNLLLGVIVLQFVFIIHLLSPSHEQVQHGDAHSHTGESALDASRAESAEMDIFFEDVPLKPQEFDAPLPKATAHTRNSAGPPPAVVGGVAAVVLLHAPKWFQRRYTLMIQNVYNNLPPGWVIQLFYLPGEGQSQAGLDINKHLSGAGGMIPTGKVKLTEIPQHIFKRYKKRVELMQSPWLWQSMLADKVRTCASVSLCVCLSFVRFCPCVSICVSLPPSLPSLVLTPTTTTTHNIRIHRSSSLVAQV